MNSTTLTLACTWDVNQTRHRKLQTPWEHTEIEIGAVWGLTQCRGDWTSSLAFSVPSWNHIPTATNPKLTCKMLLLSKIAFQVKTGRGQGGSGSWEARCLNYSTMWHENSFSTIDTYMDATHAISNIKAFRMSRHQFGFLFEAGRCLSPNCAFNNATVFISKSLLGCNSVTTLATAGQIM